MRMHSEEGSDAGKSAENGEAASLGAPDLPEPSISQKYRELKSKLKYLIYERRCFESELGRAQSRLVELSRDKTVLLDQLLQYEPVSGDEDDVTNYSGSEDEAPDKPVPKQPGEGLGQNSLSVKPSSIRSSRSPVATTASHPSSKPSNLTKQGIAKATAIINSVSNNITTKAAKVGTKRQAKQTVKSAGGGAGTAVKISKTISRVRHNAATPDEGTVPSTANSTTATAKQELVVSYPINSLATESGGGTTTTITHAPSTTAPLPTTVTSTTLATTNKIIRPVPALTKAKPSPSSSLLVSSMGSVHVTTLSSAAATTIPPLIPDNGKTVQKKSSSTSSSSSSGSSSDSDSAESGSDLSSDSEEAMDTEDVTNMEGAGPVQIVSSVKNSDNLPRPKAILSPVKIVPPMLVRGGDVPTPPPTVVSPQPAFASWNQSQASNATGEVISPLSGTEVGMFVPIASPLSSPPALPFSSLNNPGASSSAFQVFSPKRITTPSSPQVISVTLPPLLTPTSAGTSSHVHTTKPDTAKANSRPNSAGHSNSK